MFNVAAVWIGDWSGVVGVDVVGGQVDVVHSV